MAINNETFPLQPLQHLWLDALGIMAPAIGQANLKQLYLETKLEIRQHGTGKLFKFGQYHTQHIIEVPPFVVTDLYHVEQVEALLYAAARIYISQTGAGLTELRALCRDVGCYHENIATIADRWLWLCYEQQYQRLPCAVYEDRPRCQLCKWFVSTGASSKDRPEVHQNCIHFAHRVLLPQLRLQREAQAILKAEASVAETIGET